MAKFFQHERAMVHKDAVIGDDTRIWACTNIQAGAKIGQRCNICDGSFVERGGVLGNDVTIKHHVSIFDGVILEDFVFVGSNVAFINDRYPRSRAEDWEKEETIIKKGATIGTNAVILCGLTIGEYAVIGAGSVVTKDVHPYTIVVGNPAKPKGYACRCGRTLDEQFSCTCGKKYELDGIRLKFSHE